MKSRSTCARFPIVLSITVAAGAVACSGGSVVGGGAPAPSASATAQTSLAPGLGACPRLDSAALATALPGTWTVKSAGSKDPCRTELVSGQDTVSFSVSAALDASDRVARFKSAGPTIPQTRLLGELQLGADAAAMAGSNDKGSVFQVEVAQPTYLIAVLANLQRPSPTERLEDTAAALGRWMLAQKPGKG